MILQNRWNICFYVDSEVAKLMNVYENVNQAKAADVDTMSSEWTRWQ
jgi:hypothetical protein